ncbi:hypothetical protein F4553_003709 [Allocatelliglobosispora scoriae]|uniref:Ig-like domain-containing protein n=1 Tax=Allocatelliglobosispora scoriae TaxID=643052 RepID=A0A841BU83_9ACTN|nr:hypothetical protein [Allocatelliglobosispora scoriae]MBB5870330.1 hypothetical protein [Allocatelliglobosispora scoriae]
MRMLSRLGATLAATTLAVVGAVAMSSPASARINPAGLLECESGGYYHYTCVILDAGPLTNQVWKYNGSVVAAGNGHSSLYGQCAANLRFSIGVTYTRPNGTSVNTGMTLNCLQYWQ